MYLYVTGTLRNANDPQRHGKITKINWTNKTIDKTIDRVFPTPFCARNGNPRGGTRGWRGIVHGNTNDIIIANNDSLIYFTYDLDYKYIVTHPSFGNIHGLSYVNNQLCITSTLNDTYSLCDNYSMTVIEPLANPEIYKLVSPWLKIRGRDRKPYDKQRDYREEWLEDTLHLNYIFQRSDKSIIGLFNSMNLLIQLSPSPKILWSPSLHLKRLEVPRTLLGLECPHDLVYQDDNRILINSSARQEVYSFNVTCETLKLVWSTNEKSLGWNRGLALKNNSLFIGTGYGIIIEIDISTSQEISRMQVFDEKEPCAIFGILISDQ